MESPFLRAHQKHTSPFPHYRLTTMTNIFVNMCVSLIPKCVVLAYQDSSFHNRQKCRTLQFSPGFWTFSPHLNFARSHFPWRHGHLTTSFGPRSIRLSILGRCGRAWEDVMMVGLVQQAVVQHGRGDMTSPRRYKCRPSDWVKTQ